MADIPFVRLVGRLTLTSGDSSDTDLDPDVIPCDSGTVQFAPVNSYMKVVGGKPVPFSAGNATIEVPIDSDGYLTWQSARFVPMLDFTSSAVNPRVEDGKATHNVTFRGVKAQGTAVSFPGTTVRLAADTAEALVDPERAAAYGLSVGDLVCDLTKLTPVPAAGGTPIVVGPPGASVQSLAVEGNALKATLTNGDELSTDLPAPMVDSDAFVADRINTPTSQTAKALNTAIAAFAFDPSDVGYDVILLAGQSNMVGYGEGTIDTTYLDPADARVKQYAGSGTYAGQVVTAIDPLYHHEQKAGTVGHGMVFAREYARRIKPNRRVLLVPTAHGSTGFTTTSADTPPAGFHGPFAGSWDPAKGDGGFSLYQYAVDQANAAIASGSNNRIAAVLWLQGEADANYLTTSQYAAKLDALIAGFRANITGAADVPFLLGQMRPSQIAASGNFRNIHAAHVNTPARVTLTGFYYGPAGQAYYNTGDSLHYSNAGQRALGPSAIGALDRATSNVMDTDPVAPPSVTLAQSGSSIVATIGQAAGRVTDYLIEYAINAGAWTTWTHSASIDSAVTLPGIATGGDSVQVRAAAVNEQGTSAKTISAPLAVISAPSQVTGVTLGTATASTQPLTWAATSGATSYLVEYRKHTDSAWTSASTVTGTSATVAGLLSSTSYDYRVTASNVAGSGAASATVTGTTAGLGTLLGDMGTLSTATLFYAHGLRKLVPGYSGSAIQVRRASDGNTQDIGFSGNDLDTAALATFCAGTDGFISKLYDQSGNGHIFSFTTTTTQPQIVAAGTVLTKNSKPFANFNGTSHGAGDTTAGNLGLWANGSASVMHVLQSNASAYSAVIAEGGATTTPLYGLGEISSANRNYVFFRDDSGATFFSNSGSGTGATGTTSPHVVANTDDGANVSEYIDGAATYSSSYSRSGYQITVMQRFIGKIGSAFFKGDVAEVLAFKGALTAAEVAAGQANQKSYYGI